MVPVPNICLYNTYSLVYKLHLKQRMPIQYLSNTSPTMPRVIAISGHIKRTGGLRQLPDIPLVPLGAPENCANRQGLAGAGSPAETYGGF